MYMMIILSLSLSLSLSLCLSLSLSLASSCSLLLLSGNAGRHWKNVLKGKRSDAPDNCQGILITGEGEQLMDKVFQSLLELVPLKSNQDTRHS